MNNSKVLVLLATHNGEKYLSEQLQSILEQTDVDVSILVSDDYSSDSTVEILKEFSKNNKIRVISSKFGSAQKNFYNLINNASGFDYYAFADQDDYWNKDKLKRALSYLHNDKIPELYYSVSVPTDEYLNILDKKLYNHHIVDTFGKSIVATNSQGSTMVFNRLLMEAVQNRTTNTNMMHDSWLHRTCLAIGGKVYFESIPCMLYRQHENNVIAPLGKEKSVIDKIIRRIKWFYDSESDYIVSKTCQEWKEKYSNYLSNDAICVINKILRSHTMIGKISVAFDKNITSQYKMDYLKFLRLLIVGKL